MERKDTSLEIRIARSRKILATDTWNGFKRIQFEFGGRTASVVEPSAVPPDGLPWTWTMQWWDAFVDRTGVPDLLARGFHHVWIDLFETRFDDGGIAEAAAFQRFLVDELGFAPKARLIGMSWGGFCAVRYAAAHPETVRNIYLDAPLLNFDGFAQLGVASTPTEAAARIGPWAAMPPDGGRWTDDPRMPVNRAEPIAKAGIPVLLLYGGQDQTVPPQFNSEPFSERFKAAGGRITVRKRDLFGHHPHGVDPNKTDVIVDFLADALHSGESSAPVRKAGRPLMSLRLKSVETETPERWRDCFSALAAHPGCCDEIWFSTGTQMADIEWHRANASVIAEAAKEVERLGITPTLQFQATIGHDDALAIPGMSTAKTWTGWTGWDGREDRYCSCPRQPAFHDYLRNVAATYAKIGFSALWIDDDLRLSGHKPADNGGGRVGCWCDTCIGAFSVETGVRWTRDALAKAILDDEALSARWRSFSIDSLRLVARCIAETFRSLSPDTMMGLQHVNFPSQTDQVRALLETLHEAGGEVGFRPGGGEYYDSNPEGLVVKSIRTGEARMRLGDPGWVKVWTPEIESWPRTYYSRSPQGVLVEAFSALMFGMNSISFFVSDASKETNELYARTLWKALAGAAPALRGYAEAIEGCMAIGYRTAPVEWDASVGIRRAAIPVLAGPGRAVGELTEGERGLDVNTMTSGEVQNLRDELDRRAGGLPATVCSPFNGLMQMHVDAEGHIRTVALLGMSLSSQENIRIRLRPPSLRAESAVWHAMGRSPERLKIERSGGAAFATIPEIAAWNGGWLEF